MSEKLVPIAISSQLDVTGEERIHAAKYDPVDRPFFLGIFGDLTDGMVGDTGTYQYAVGGTYHPLVVTLIDGALPTGATIDEAGLVTFDYEEAGSFSWTLQVEDAQGNTATLEDTAEISTTMIDMFIAVSSNGEIAKSLDGIAWELVTDTNDDLRRISYVGGRWIITSGNDSITYTSIDGDTWTPGALSSPSTNATHNLPPVWTFTGNYMVGKDTSTFYRSTDGATWTSAALSAGTTGLNCAASNGTDILFGDNSRTVWKSTNDGTSWTSYSVTDISAGGDILDMLYSFEESLYIAVAANVSNDNVVTSTDGETWTTRHGGGVSLRAVAYGDGTFMIGGDSLLLKYATTNPPTSWTAGTHTFTDSINGIAFGLGTFVAVSSANEIQYSTDGGATWTGTTSPFSPAAVIRSIAFGTTNNV